MHLFPPEPSSGSSRPSQDVAWGSWLRWPCESLPKVKTFFLVPIRQRNNGGPLCVCVDLWANQRIWQEIFALTKKKEAMFTKKRWVQTTKFVNLTDISEMLFFPTRFSVKNSISDLLLSQSDLTKYVKFPTSFPIFQHPPFRVGVFRRHGTFSIRWSSWRFKAQRVRKWTLVGYRNNLYNLYINYILIMYWYCISLVTIRISSVDVCLFSCKDQWHKTTFYHSSCSSDFRQINISRKVKSRLKSTRLPPKLLEFLKLEAWNPWKTNDSSYGFYKIHTSKSTMWWFEIIWETWGLAVCLLWFHSAYARSRGFATESWSFGGISFSALRALC